MRPLLWFDRSPTLKAGRYLLACWLAVAFAAGLAFCQEEPKPASPATEPAPAKPEAADPTPPTKRDVQGPPVPAGLPASELDTYLLRDSKGNLVPVIGWTFEDFETLLKIRRGLQPPPPPAYSFDSLTITGKAEGSAADLQLTAVVRVREAGWVKVPLRLNQAAILETPKYQGPGEHVLGGAESAEGNVLCLKGEGKSHQLQLRVAVPLIDASGERRLTLSLPRATESQVRIQVPYAGVIANLRNGSEGILSTKPVGNKQTELQVVGAVGDLQLAWQESRAAATAGKPAVEVSGEILVRVESRSRLSAEARFKLRSLGKPLETVQVRLPPGMQLVPAPATGYSVTAAAEPTLPVPDAKGNSGNVVEVQFDRPTIGPVDVRLLAEQEIPLMGEAPVRPGRFEVLGAQRQRGSIDFLVEGDWNLNWADEASTRRVELVDLPGTSGRPVARFEYFKQPLDLRLNIIPRPTRIAVEPQYQVFVDANRLRLEATLRFRIRGPRAATANLDLAGWQIDRIAGENATEQPLPPTDNAMQLPLPLTQVDPTKGEVTFRLSGHQPLPTEGNELQFSLPRAQVDISTPATILIQPADNIELTPTTSELKGLVADSAQSVEPGESRRQPPLVYRDLGSSEPILFVGKRLIRARQVSVKAATAIHMRRSAAEVEQRIDYQIAYEPMLSFFLVLPSSVSLADLKGLQATIDGELLEHRAATSDDGRNLIEVLDYQPRLGSVELLLSYSIPLPAMSAERAAKVSIPLIRPADMDFDRALGQTLRIEHPEELHLQLAPVGSASGDLLTPSGRGLLEGKSEQLVSTLEADVSLLQTPEISGLVIDRMWLQTWLGPQQRQDRCAIQLRTAAASLALRLPSVETSSFEVLVDGKRVPTRTTGDATVEIDLGPQATPQERVLELWYSTRRSPMSWAISERELIPPHLEGASAPQRIYWQVVLSSNEHLLLDPPNYAPVMKWAWRGYYWSRVADYDQRWLEDWCRASRQEPLPDSLNNYLYSTVGTETPLQLHTIGQRPLAAGLAGLGLLVGLLLLHVPAVRSPSGLLVLAMALVGFGLAAPQTMLFAAQAVALGLLIVVLLALFRWMWTGKGVAASTPVIRSPSQVSSPRSAGSRSGSAPPPPTTAAAPILPPAPQEVEP